MADTSRGRSKADRMILLDNLIKIRLINLGFKNGRKNVKISVFHKSSATAAYIICSFYPFFICYHQRVIEKKTFGCIKRLAHSLSYSNIFESLITLPEFDADVNTKTCYRPFFSLVLIFTIQKIM